MEDDEQQEHTVVRLVAFDKTPTIDVNYLASLAVVASQHVEAAYSLPKALANACSPHFLFVA